MTSSIIETPTSIKAGEVASGGIDIKNGAKNRANRKHIAAVKDVKPHRPPTLTPEELSTKVVTVEVPNTAPTVVPIASAIKACLIRGILPFSSTIPARLLTPISVPIVSNISMKRNVRTHTAISILKICSHSNLNNMGERLGGVSKMAENRVTPIGIPMIVVASIPISKAPGTFLTISTEDKRIPKQARSTAGS